MLGFVPKLVAVWLLIMTAMIQVVLPRALWSRHVYWTSLLLMLLVLLLLSSGPISVDHVIRWLSRRQ